MNLDDVFQTACPGDKKWRNAIAGALLIIAHRVAPHWFCHEKACQMKDDKR